MGSPGERGAGSAEAPCNAGRGRDVLARGEGGSEGGGGVGWDTPPLGSPYGPRPKAGRKFLGSNPLGTEGAEANFRLSASNIGRGGGGGGGGGTPPLLLRCTAVLIYPRGGGPLCTRQRGRLPSRAPPPLTASVLLLSAARAILLRPLQFGAALTTKLPRRHQSRSFGRRLHVRLRRRCRRTGAGDGRRLGGQHNNERSHRIPLRRRLSRAPAGSSGSCLAFRRDEALRSLKNAS